MVIRLAGVGFALVSALNLTAYVFKCRHDNVPMGAGHCVWLLVPLVIGAVVLIKSSAWAERLSNYLDD